MPGFFPRLHAFALGFLGTVCLPPFGTNTQVCPYAQHLIRTEGPVCVPRIIYSGSRGAAENAEDIRLRANDHRTNT